MFKAYAGGEQSGFESEADARAWVMERGGGLLGIRPSFYAPEYQVTVGVDIGNVYRYYDLSGVPVVSISDPIDGMLGVVWDDKYKRVVFASPNNGREWGRVIFFTEHGLHKAAEFVGDAGVYAAAYHARIVYARLMFETLLLTHGVDLTGY